MPENEAESALRRKVGARRPSVEMASMSPATALRKATARAAQSMGGLAIAVTGFREERTTVDALVQGLPDPAMLLLLNGPDGALGLAVVDAQLVAGVVEFATTGRVVPAVGDARAPTRTDTILVSELLDRILTQFDENLLQVDKAPPLSGFRYATALKEGRSVTLAMEELPYRCFRLTLDVGRGAKSAQVLLAFPWFNANVAQLGKQNSNEWKAALASTVSGTSVTLEAVLHRFSMPLRQVAQWQAGSLVPVPVTALTAVAVQGGDNRRVATGKLGQSGGWRAIRILDDPKLGLVRDGHPKFAPNSGVALLDDAATAAPQMQVDPSSDQPAPD